MGIHGEQGKPSIILLGYGSTWQVVVNIPLVKVFEIPPWHGGVTFHY
jgi:hypothetical protein